MCFCFLENCFRHFYGVQAQTVKATLKRLKDNLRDLKPSVLKLLGERFAHHRGESVLDLFPVHFHLSLSYMNLGGHHNNKSHDDKSQINKFGNDWGEERVGGPSTKNNIKQESL